MTRTLLPLFLSIGLASCAMPGVRTPMPPFRGGDSSPRPTQTLAIDPVVTAGLPAGGEAVGSESSYTMLKVGPFYGRGDLDGLDTGLWAEAVFGRHVLPFLSLEGSVGYVQVDGTGPLGMTNFDMWGLPVLAQARVSVPVLIFEPYGGVGLGGMYVSADGNAGSSVSDFVWAADAFLGVSVGLGDLAVGIEGKYLKTDKVDNSFEVEGVSGTVFASLPF